MATSGAALWGRTMIRNTLSFGLVVVSTNALAAGQACAPVVTMSVTLPDGRTHELTAAESGLATVSLGTRDRPRVSRICNQFAFREVPFEVGHIAPRATTD
jgi:hypothetical protein